MINIQKPEYVKNHVTKTGYLEKGLFGSSEIKVFVFKCGRARS